MEEVWKNIHLSSLTESATTTAMGLLTRPTDKTGPSLTRFWPSSKENQIVHNRQKEHNNHHHDKIDGQDEILETGINSPCFMSCFNSPIETLASNGPCSSSSSPCPSFLLSRLGGRNKRVADEDQSQNDEFRSDRRYKRMMKNRESAARSRARRQAYTNELELEVAQLTEENAKLRKEQEKLMLSAPAEAPPKKATLSRSLTAPF